MSTRPLQGAILSIFSKPLRLQNWVFLFVVVSGIKFLVIVLLLPNSPVVPDERLYVLLLSGLGSGVDGDEVTAQLGYGATLITGTWLFIAPTEVLQATGLETLVSLRLVSFGFNTLATLLVLLIAHRLRPQGISFRSLAGLSLLVLLCLPSYQFWGILGLRDSSAIFALAVICWGLSLVTISPTPMTSSLGLVALFAGVIFLQTSRSYLALIACTAVALAVVLPPLRGRALVVFAVLGVLFAGNFLGYQIRAVDPQPIASSPEEDLAKPYSDFTESLKTANSGNNDSAADLGVPAGRVAPPSAVGTGIRNLYATREGLRLNAASAFASNYCQPKGAALSTLSCELANLPLGIYRFLWTPNLIETGWGAPSQRLAAGLENVIWLVVYVAAIMCVVARRSLSPRLTVFLVTLLVLSTVAYALVSGNEGTAFRHKGQFLSAWCLLIVLGTGWRPWVRSLRQPKQSASPDAL